MHQRLDLLQEQMGKSFTSSIVDLVNEDGHGEGTKVEVAMFTGF